VRIASILVGIRSAASVAEPEYARNEVADEQQQKDCADNDRLDLPYTGFVLSRHLTPQAMGA
jgi:hypothetical protein